MYIVTNVGASADADPHVSFVVLKRDECLDPEDGEGQVFHCHIAARGCSPRNHRYVATKDLTPNTRVASIMNMSEWRPK